MKLEITKERVLKAVESCPESEKVLREIFPEAFDKSVQVKNFSALIETTKGTWLLSPGLGNEWNCKSIKLNTHFFNWKIEKVNRDISLLIPTRK